MPRPARKLGWAAAGLALCLLAAPLALPQASWNAFLRWLQPAANVERYTLVVLDGFPARNSSCRTASRLRFPALSATAPFGNRPAFWAGSAGRPKPNPPCSRAKSACKFPAKWRMAF